MCDVVKVLHCVLVFQSVLEAYNQPDGISLPRESWNAWDPMLIAEGLFAAANIFRYICLIFTAF